MQPVLPVPAEQLQYCLRSTSWVLLTRTYTLMMLPGPDQTLQLRILVLN